MLDEAFFPLILTILLPKHLDKRCFWHFARTPSNQKPSGNIWILDVEILFILIFSFIEIELSWRTTDQQYSSEQGQVFSILVRNLEVSSELVEKIFLYVTWKLNIVTTSEIKYFSQQRHRFFHHKILSVS